MITFEQMKNKIPEGATHYSDENENTPFAWCFSDHMYIPVIRKESDHQLSNSDFDWKRIPAVTLEEEEVIEALEKAMEKLNKTYRYEKVTDSIFDLKEEFERGELFEMVGVEIYREVKKERYFAESFFHETLYRRIELTERDLFIETYAWAVQDDVSNVGDIAGMLFDSGKFKLVNGKG